MPVFKLKVIYENPSTEDVMEVQAENTAAARAMCLGVVGNHEATLRGLESKNIYTSKRIVSCDLIERPWRDALMCLPNLKDDV